MRNALSALLMGIVGSVIGGVTLGLCTFYVYFIGAYLGLPLGFLLGLWYGWKMPLRDAAITFFCYHALCLIVLWQIKISSGNPEDDFWRALSWLCLLGPGGLILPRLPVLGLPFEYRRPMAIVLAVLWTLAAAVWVYWKLWIWEPGT